MGYMTCDLTRLCQNEQNYEHSGSFDSLVGKKVSSLCMQLFIIDGTQ